MAFTYDMETDLRFQEGKRLEERRRKEKTNQAIINLSELGVDSKKIAKAFDVSIDFVEAVLKQKK